PLARGESAQVQARSQALFAEQVSRAAGEAGSFTHWVAGRRSGPTAAAVTDFRLYAEAVEEALAGARLTVVTAGASRARRGVTLAAPGALSFGAIGGTEVAAPPQASEGVGEGDVRE
ncbi:MAG: hypothetical protein JXR77_11950, partial [Lentisphaeria bacterium]|nr:hypothetical protein [Lentisphaeria bacterium]